LLSVTGLLDAAVSTSVSCYVIINIVHASFNGLYKPTAAKKTPPRIRVERQAN